MMRKYLVILAAGALLAAFSAVLGVGFTALLSGGESGGADAQESWLPGQVAVRGEEAYDRAAAGFRERFGWLVGGDEKPDADAEAAALAAAASEPPPPPPPRWDFVGVLLEEASQVALVAEAGKVRKYKVGDAFADGTLLLAVSEQSMRVSKAGEERDVYLYRRN